MDRAYLDKNFDFILKPGKQQYMLNKFCAIPENAKFFNCKNLVEIYTQEKMKLEGFLTLKSDGRVVFTNQTPGDDKIAPGDNLLIVPQQKPHVILVPATVETVSNSHILMAPVDPRRRTRFRSRLLVGFHPLDVDTFNHIKNHDIHAFRHNELSRTTTVKPYLTKVQDKIEDDNKAVHNGASFVGKGRPPIKAILADVSVGGCCLFVAIDKNAEVIKESKLLFVLLDMPHPSKVMQAQVFVSIRRLRVEKEFLVLNCMFIDELPKELLLV
jgi:hypothetical protein